MVVRVYICNSCSGSISERTFDCEYADIAMADAAEIPPCPKCGTRDSVERFFGHQVYSSIKRPVEVPGDLSRYSLIDAEKYSGRSIFSLGFRLDDPEAAPLREALSESFEAVPDNCQADSPAGYDPIEEKLHLRKGTASRALFEHKTRKLIDELNSGKKASAFFMSVTDDSAN